MLVPRYFELHVDKIAFVILEHASKLGSTHRNDGPSHKSLLDLPTPAPLTYGAEEATKHYLQVTENHFQRRRKKGRRRCTKAPEMV